MNRKSVAVALFSLLAIAVLVTIAAAVYLLTGSNDRDSRDPWAKASMLKVTLEWGRLAPLPKNISNYTIRTEGNSFTRSFYTSFTASKSDIEQWVKASPGLAETTPTQQPDGSEKYAIKPGGGANLATVTIDENTGKVDIYVEWS